MAHARFCSLMAAAAIAAVGWSSSASAGGAGFWVDPEPTIWKKILAKPGEYPYLACKRVFGLVETYAWAQGPGRTVYCQVSYANVYAPGEVKQNFNTR
ncbi:MAG: hypothetical protein U1E46_17630 [Hyphomicrobiales bacterium]